MAYEYTITIKKEQAEPSGVTNPSTTPEATPNNPSAPQTPKRENGNNEKSTSSAVKAMVVAEGKRYAKYIASNVGKYSGDSSLQTQVNNSIEGASLAVGFVTNPYMTAAASTFSIIKTLVDGTFERLQEKNRTEAARARNGYTDSKSIVTSRRH